MQHLLNDIAAEVARARTKFPLPNRNLLALLEEVGELAEALMTNCSAAELRAEAVQVAAMAVRIAEEGSTEFDMNGPKDWSDESTEIAIDAVELGDKARAVLEDHEYLPEITSTVAQEVA